LSWCDRPQRTDYVDFDESIHDQLTMERQPRKSEQE
jgi:hypothetical protein